MDQAFRIAAFPATLATQANRKIAIPSNLAEIQMTPEVWTAFESALARLCEKGFILQPLDLADHSFSCVRRAGLLLSKAELLNSLALPLSIHRDEMQGDLLDMLNYATGRTDADLAWALSIVVEAGRWLTYALLPFDGLLLHTAGQTAFAMDGPEPHYHADFATMANMSGVPSISLPLPVMADALLIGLQLIGHRGHDVALLDAAQHIEAALR